MLKSPFFHRLETTVIQLSKPDIEQILAISIFTFFLFVIVSPLHNQPVGYWAYGDWLINYSGGFVRRGLGGQVILFIADASGIPLDTIVRFGMIILTAILLCIILMIIPRLNSIQVFWLCFGPCLLFPTLYNPYFYGRKDIIVILLLFFHCLVFTYSFNVRRFQSYVLPPLLIVSTLIYEIQLFFVPFHLLIISLHEEGDRRLQNVLINALLPSVAFLLVMINNGTPEHVAKICETLLHHDAAKAYQAYCIWDPNVNGYERGPIYNFGRSKFDEFVGDQISVFLGNRTAFQAYAVLYLLNISLTFLLFRCTLSEFKKSSLLNMFVLANCAFIVCIMTGVDIGRWIVLVCFHNFVVLFCGSVYYSKKESVTFLAMAGVLLASVFVYVGHTAASTAGSIGSFNDIIKSRLGEAWANGLLSLVKFLKYIG